jgi:hypothetical protein
VQIRIVGKHKRDLMILVAYELEKIHATYKNLAYEHLVPCNCEICHDSEEPETIRLVRDYRFHRRQTFPVQTNSRTDSARLHCPSNPENRKMTGPVISWTLHWSARRSGASSANWWHGGADPPNGPPV